VIEAEREVVHRLTVGVARGVAVAGALVTTLLLRLAIEPVLRLAGPRAASELPNPFRPRCGTEKDHPGPRSPILERPATAVLRTLAPGW
jgi:hypothetical protein